jgi:hypothetical protein
MMILRTSVNRPFRHIVDICAAAGLTIVVLRSQQRQRCHRVSIPAGEVDRRGAPATACNPLLLSP